MRILILNLSPRKSGTCSMLANYFKDEIDKKEIDRKEINQKNKVINKKDKDKKDIDKKDIDKKDSQVPSNTEIIPLYSYLNNMQIVLNKVKDADTLVFIGPCYVDSYPAETISLLEQMAASPLTLHEQKLYGFIQGGMPYIHTHVSGINMLQNFAECQKLKWQGGFVMGGGAVLNGQSIDHVIGAKAMVPAINRFIDSIYQGNVSEPDLYEKVNFKMPAIMAWLLSKYMSNMIKKKYKGLGISYNQPSPYRMK